MIIIIIPNPNKFKCDFYSVSVCVVLQFANKIQRNSIFDVLVLYCESTWDVYTSLRLKLKNIGESHVGRHRHSYSRTTCFPQGQHHISKNHEGILYPRSWPPEVRRGLPCGRGFQPRTRCGAYRGAGGGRQERPLQSRWWQPEGCPGFPKTRNFKFQGSTDFVVIMWPISSQRWKLSF